MKVLLVDDEADIRKVAQLSLTAIGKITTVVASSARQAIDMAALEQPDLILMDMMMPGMDGLSALAKFRNSPVLKQIPVVFFTAKVQQQEIEHYLSVGAIGVIEKPFDPMALSDQIRRIYAEWQARGSCI